MFRLSFLFIFLSSFFIQLQAQDYKHSSDIRCQFDVLETGFKCNLLTRDLIESSLKNVVFQDDFFDSEMSINRLKKDYLFDYSINNNRFVDEYYFDTNEREFLELNISGCEFELEDILDNLENPLAIRTFCNKDESYIVSGAERIELIEKCPLEFQIEEIMGYEFLYLKVFSSQELEVGKTYTYSNQSLSECLDCTSTTQLDLDYKIISIDNDLVEFMFTGLASTEYFGIEYSDDEWLDFDCENDSEELLGAEEIADAADEQLIEECKTGFEKEKMLISGKGSFKLSDRMEHNISINYFIDHKIETKNQSFLLNIDMAFKTEAM